MGASDALPEVAAEKAGTEEWAQSDEPAPSERQSLYQLAGATRGTLWPRALECFIPLVMFGSVEVLTYGLKHILHVDYAAWTHGSAAWDPTTVALKPIGGSLSSIVEDSSVRNVMALWSIAFFVLALGALSTAWYVIFESLGHTRLRRRAMTGVAAVAVCIFFAMWGVRAPGATKMIITLQDRIGLHMQITHLHALYALMFASGNAVVACAACAMGAVLFPDLSDHNPSSQADIAFLGRRMRWMRAMLYAVGPLFAVSTVVDYNATSMIAVYLTGAEDQVAMRLMASRATLTFATLYSIILVCMYAPTEAILRIRAVKVASDAHVKGGERAAWLKDRGLQLSAVDQFKAVLAVLLPILVELFRQSVTALVKG